MKTAIARNCLLALLIFSIAAVATAQRGRPIVSFKSGPFKMNKLEGGGAVPASGPVVKILYDRTHRRYSDIDQKPLEVRATVTAACADLKLKALTLTTLGATVRVSGSGLTNLAGVLTGSTTFTTDEISTAKLASVVPDPVATCNHDMEAMVKQNQHGKVQKGWARMYDDALLAELTARCEGEPQKKAFGFVEPGELATPSDSERFPVWVHCSPAPVFRVETSSRQPPAKKSEPQRASGADPRPGGLSQGGAATSDPPSGASTPRASTSAARSRGESALADLVITSAQPAPTSRTTLRLEMANTGQGRSSPTTVAVFYHRSGHVVKKSFDVPALEPGATRRIVADLGSPLEHAERLTARINDSGRAQESDLSNNTLTIK